MVRHHYPALFQADTPEHARAVELAGRTYEFSEFLVNQLGVIDVGAEFPHRVTYHASCHLLRGLGVRQEPLQLLRAVRGLELAPLEDAETCCGFGGVYSVVYPEVSRAMLQDSVILDAIRNALQRRSEDNLSERPPVVSPRQAASQIEELQLLIHEVEKLSGHAQLLSPHQIQAALSELVQTYQVKQAVLWDTPTLRQLEVAAKLESMGVRVVPAHAHKQALAECDLGVTEADFALPETGTLGLLSNAEQPRLVSLLPRLHLTIVPPSALRTDLHQVFAEAKSRSYMILITGPSRTSDIELTPTLGVHGPRDVCVWILDEIRQTGNLPPPD